MWNRGESVYLSVVVPVPSTPCLCDNFPINMFLVTKTVGLVSNPPLSSSGHVTS